MNKSDCYDLKLSQAPDFFNNPVKQLLRPLMLVANAIWAVM